MAPLLFIPSILEIIPSLISLFGKGERGQQNAQAAQIVVDAFKAAVPGAVNTEDALAKVAASAELKAQVKSGGNIEAAKLVGGLIGKRAVELGFEQVVFDRGGYQYHGRVAALANGAREAGLKF